MLIDVDFLGNKDCLLFHEGKYLYCAWDIGGKVIAVELISGNYPSLTLCVWPSVTGWWLAVESVPWLQDDLLRLASELADKPDADPQVRALAVNFQRQLEDEYEDSDDEDDDSVKDE